MARPTIPTHLQDRFAAVEALPISDAAPAPWAGPKVFHVGGLTEVGFAENSDLLLVLSFSGRGVIDCLRGEKIARDDGPIDLDVGNLTVQGVGPLAGKIVHVGGSAGGGLPSATNDGWGCEKHPLAWPDEEILLFPNGHSLLHSTGDHRVVATKFGKFASSVCAFGFSPTGRTFAIATSSDLTLFTR